MSSFDISFLRMRLSLLLYIMKAWPASWPTEMNLLFSKRRRTTVIFFIIIVTRSNRIRNKIFRKSELLEDRKLTSKIYKIWKIYVISGPRFWRKWAKNWVIKSKFEQGFGAVLKIIFKFLTFLFNHFLDEGIPYFRQVLRSHILFIEPFFLNLLHISWRRFFMTYKLSVGRILWHDDIFGIPTCPITDWHKLFNICHVFWRFVSVIREFLRLENFFPRIWIFTFVILKIYFLFVLL